MISHYFKSAFRSLWKNRIFTGINILGLAVSFSVAIVIYLVVDYHFSFDDFHQDKDKLFRVTTTSYFVDESFPNSGAPVPLAEVIESSISGVEKSVFFRRFWSSEATIINPDKENKVLIEKNSNRIFTSSKYFDFFDYEWLAGSKESLDEPHNLVLTDELAGKYFGKIPYKDILGKQISFDNKPPVKVSGVVKSLDLPTEFIFSSFISLPTLETSHYDFYKGWDGVSSDDQLLIKIGGGISPKNIEEQIPKVEKRYSNVEGNGNKTYELQPIEDIHFSRKYGNYKQPRVHKPTLYVLIVITFLLLILSFVNFINLTTALAGNRSKEFNVRKTLGSPRIQLIYHLVIEAFLIVFAASVLALSILPFVFQVFSDFIPTEISPSGIFNWKRLFYFFNFIFIVAILTGSFPVLSLSKYIGLVKSYRQSGTKTAKRSGYKALAILQFAISILIIIATLSVEKQVLFSLNKDLGYQTEAIINFPAPDGKKEMLLNEIKKIPGVQSISLAGSPPASGSTTSGTYDFEYENRKSEIHADIKYGDSVFINLYEINLLFGRNLELGDSSECLVNQAFLKRTNVSDPSKILGAYIGNMQIVGIVEDFHMKSTYMPINPVIIQSREENFNTFHVKLFEENAFSREETIKDIETAWNKVDEKDDFHYQFYDDQIAAFYNTEKSIVKLLTWISGLTIFISCLGLLGIAVFSIGQRVKEIGIRKVNGARIDEILFLLNKDFVKWVIIAFVIACPIAWYAMNKWLENFAYKTELSWWIFALAGVLALGIALLTVSWQSWRAATRNPVEALRYE